MEPAERILVRYERLKDIVTLAIRMQGLRGGLTLDDIQAEFGVSRRTAERMRDAVEGAFAPLETVECGDNKLAAALGRAPPPRPALCRRTGGAGVRSRVLIGAPIQRRSAR